jgi:hypothetical protein
MSNDDIDSQALKRTLVVIAAMALGLLMVWVLIRSREPAPPVGQVEGVLPGGR